MDASKLTWGAVCAHDRVDSDAFGYDAVFAVALALHDLVEVQNRTEIVGRELLDTLLKRVAFEGVTGFVTFHDASADTDRLYHGDRREGFAYWLLNYVDNYQGLVVVGKWVPCAHDVTSCAWSTQWLSAPGVAMTFSTENNSRPPQTASCPFGEVLSEAGLCVCDSGFEPESTADGDERCQRCAPGYSKASPGRTPCEACVRARPLFELCTPAADAKTRFGLHMLCMLACWHVGMLCMTKCCFAFLS